MKIRIAKKIIAGEFRLGAPRWNDEQFATAHRRWCKGARRGARVTRIRPAVARTHFTSTPKTATGRAIQGGRYLTSEGRYLYLHDTGADRWILPVIKTGRQEAEIRAHAARLGATVDGAQLINDGDAFTATVCRTFRGKPVVLAVNFTMRGVNLRHQTVTLERFDPRATLAAWRAADPFKGGLS
jgi:hypothetical protein